MEFRPSGAFGLLRHTVINDGTIRKTGSLAGTMTAHSVTSSGPVEVQEGTLNIHYASADGLNSFGGTLTGSAGAVLELGGSGAGGSTVVFESSSSLAVPNVVFGTDGSVSIEGVYDVAESTTVKRQTSVVFAPSATVQNIGEVLVVTGDSLGAPEVILNSGGGISVSDLQVIDATLRGSDDLSITNSFTWESVLITTSLAGGGALTIAPGASVEITGGSGLGPSHVLTERTVDNNDTIVFSGTSNLAAGEGATLNNLVSGLIDVQNDSDVTGVNGTFMTVNNAGTMQNNAGVGTSTWEVCFNDLGGSVTGDIDIQGQCP